MKYRKESLKLYCNFYEHRQGIEKYGSFCAAKEEAERLTQKGGILCDVDVTINVPIPEPRVTITPTQLEDLLTEYESNPKVIRFRTFINEKLFPGYINE